MTTFLVFHVSGNRLWAVPSDKILHMTFTPPCADGSWEVITRLVDSSLVAHRLEPRVSRKALQLIRQLNQTGLAQSRPQPRNPSGGGSRYSGRHPHNHPRGMSSRQA